MNDLITKLDVAAASPDAVERALSDLLPAYKTVFDAHASDAVIRNLSGRVIYSNDVLGQWIGWTNRDLFQHESARGNPEDWQCEVLKAQKGETTIRKVQLDREDGSSKAFYRHVSAIQRDGVVLGTLELNSEISAEWKEEEASQKEALLTLGVSEEQYRLLFNYSPVPAIEFDMGPQLELFKSFAVTNTEQLKQLYRDNDVFLKASIERIRLRRVNSAALAYYEANDLSELQERYHEVFTSKSHEMLCSMMVAFLNEAHILKSDTVSRTLKGRYRYSTVSAFLNRADRTAILQLVDQTAEKELRDMQYIQAELIRSMGKTTEFRTAAKRTLNILVSGQYFDSGGFYFYEKETDTFTLYHCVNVSSAFRDSVVTISGPSERFEMLKKMEPTAVDYDTMLHYSTEMADELEEGVRSFAFFPVVYESSILAVFVLGSHSIGQHDDHMIRGYHNIISQLAELFVRIQTEEALIKSRQNLQSLFNEAHDFFIIIDQDGFIQESNLSVLRQLGYTRSTLCGKHLLDLIPPDRRREGKELLKKLADGCVRATNIPLYSHSGDTVAVDSLITGGHWSGMDVFFIVSRDIRERLESDRLLYRTLARLEKFKSIVNNSPFVVFLWDLDNEGSISFVSDNVSRFGYRAEDMMSGDVKMSDVIHPADMDRIGAEVFRCLENGPDEMVQHYRLLNPEKPTCWWWVEDCTRIVRDEKGRVQHMQGIVYDISKRKVMELSNELQREQLRSLSAKIANVSEMERHQLASALHDDVGQNLASCCFYIDRLLSQCRSNDKARKDLSRVRGILDSSIQKTRSLTFELSPPVLYEIGLLPACEQLLKEFEKESGCHAELKSNWTQHITNKEFNVAVYRSVRELLHNIRKHAGASRVTLTFDQRNDGLAIRIQDNGKGFDLKSRREVYNSEKSFGLMSIRERIGYYSGEINIDSTVGEGTTVELFVPEYHLREVAEVETE